MDEQNRNFFGILDEETLRHLAESMPRQLHELEELNEVMGQIGGKVYRRMNKIKKHMQTCGDCLNKQMQLGLLIPIEDYYKAGPMMGAGRLPKLHHMMN
jgi:hypothetical protein